MAPRFHNIVVLFIISFVANLSNSSSSSAKVQWYRTARDTTDRLTQQPDLTLGTDFDSDQVVMFKR